jgi:hypothetical protein
MSYQILVHEFGCDQPKTTNELLHIITDMPLVKKQLGPSSFRAMGKWSLAEAGGGGGHHPKPLPKALEKAPKEAKRGKRGAQQVTVTTGCDNKGMDSSDEEQVLALEHDFKH